jgi:hypothetical protein
VVDRQRKRQSNPVLIDAARQSNLADTIGLAISPASGNHPAWPSALIMIDAPVPSRLSRYKKGRYGGFGSPFIKATDGKGGIVRYKRSEVDSWMLSRQHNPECGRV